MAKVRKVIVVYDDDRGVHLEVDNCPIAGVEMLLMTALAAVRRELLAARLGAPTQSGLVLVGKLPPES